MPRRFQRLLTRFTAVIMVALAASLLVGCPGSSSPFTYQVQVLDAETGRPIEGALVIIATGGKAPIGDDANTQGFAIIHVDGSYVGQMSEVTVTAPGYKGHFTDVNLNEGALPKTIRLNREMGRGETQPTKAPTPSATATPPAPALEGDPTPPPPADTPTSQPTMPPDTATPGPIQPPTSQADAVVLKNGAELRPGADTWWYARQTLPAKMELALLGYDPNFSNWVYVRTVDGASTGWTQIKNLQINVELSALPRITPRPTLTSTPGGGGQTPAPSGCEGGPLSLILYYDPGSEHCTSGSGWAVNLHFIVSGGNCTYTYFWENQLIYGPTTENEFIYTVEHGSSALVGNGEVRSGSESVKQGIYVERPNCP